MRTRAGCGPAFALFLLVGIAGVARAADQDFQIWIPMTLTARYSESFGGWYEVQPRIGEDATTVTQLILRTALDWRFRPGWAASFGYAWSPTLEPTYKNENRVYEQLLFGDDYSFGRLISRTRLEQRWIEGVSGTAWRFRTLLRANFPFSADRAWSGVLWDEIFFNLNSPSNGPQAGFDQNRFFLGVNRVLDPRLNIDAGYQLQVIDRSEPGFIDHINHMLLIQLSFTT